MGIRPIAVCSALLAAASGAFGQSKVAVVNLQQAVFETAEIKQANVDLSAKYRARDNELEALRAQGVAVTKKLQAGQDTLTDDQQAALDAQVTKLQRDVQRKNEDLQADLQRDRDEVLSKASERMVAIVKKIAEERGFDVIAEAAALLYYKPATDLTKDATAAYDLAYPLAAKPAAAAKAAGK
jgi:outer membrane protein